MSPRGRLLCLVLVSTALALLAGELCLRTLRPVLYMPLPAKISEDTWRELIHQRSSIPGLAYELEPGVQKLTQGVTVRTNSEGMRDRERSLDKPPGVFRIAVLGDSITFGFGVENEQVFPLLLERLLNASDTDTAFEVLNFGVAGYSTRDEALVLRHKVMLWSPDLVIVAYVGNDPDIDPNQPLHAYYQTPAWWQHSHLLRLIAQQKKAWEIRRYGDGDYARYLHFCPRTWNSVLEAFADMRAVTSEQEIPVLVVTLQLERALAERVASAASAAGLRAVSLSKAFRGHRQQQTQLSATDKHPNPLGHRIIAEALRDALRRDGLVP